MIKKIISMFLIICMVVGMMPISVMAEEGNTSNTSDSYTTQNEDYETATPSEAGEEPEEESEEFQEPEETVTEPEETVAETEETVTEPEETVTEPEILSPELEAATPAQALMGTLEPEIELIALPAYTFDAADEGYATPAPYQVRIKNTGTASTGGLDIELSGDNAESYTLSKTSVSNIGVDAEDYFNVAPKTGLIAGTYTATVTVSGDSVSSQSIDLSFTVTPAGNMFDVEIRTYIDGNLADVTGAVELRNLQSTAEVHKSTTGIYNTRAANGSYNIYINGEDTMQLLSVNNGNADKTINLFTVSFSASSNGTATGSTISATAGGKVISSGEVVVSGTRVTITAGGIGAAGYTYAWSGAGTLSQTTQSLTIASINSMIDAVCAVTGVGILPSDPDYKIGDNGYLWTGSDQSIILSGDGDTLSILKAPTAVIKIEVRSQELSAVTIDGNSILCENTYIEVFNDITLKLEDVNITAPDISGVVNSGLMLNKTDTETDQMNIEVSGTCNLSGSNWGSGIRSIHDQNLAITGSGTLNVNGGDTSDPNLQAGAGISMDAYTYSFSQGAKLTIDGGVTVNAKGGYGQKNNGGTGIQLSWGDIIVGDAEVNAYGGDTSAPSSWSAGHGIQASFPAYDHSKGGKIIIEGGYISAIGGDSENTYGGRGMDAFSRLEVNGGTVTAAGGDSDNSIAGDAIYVYDQNLDINGGIVTATGGNSENGSAGHGIFVYMRNLNVNEGTVTATGGNSKTNGALGFYDYLGDINLTGGTMSITGGNGGSKGSYAVLSYSGSININGGAEGNLQQEETEQPDQEVWDCVPMAVQEDRVPILEL